jgi:hypothetical protein
MREVFNHLLRAVFNLVLDEFVEHRPIQVCQT